MLASKRLTQDVRQVNGSVSHRRPPSHDNITVERPRPKLTAKQRLPYYAVFAIPVTLLIICIAVVQGRLTAWSEMVRAKHGAVATDVDICSDIGRDILRSGGSAVDSIISSALCLGTVNPSSSGIGGGGFMVLHNSDGTSTTFNCREQAPQNTSSLMFVSQLSNASKIGGLAVAVPGELLCMKMAHDRYGILPWRDLFVPSIKLARHGFKVEPLLARYIRLSYNDIITSPTLSELFIRNGRPVMEGDVITRPVFADTLESIAEHGVDIFYRGSIGQAIVQDVQEAGGVMTMDDMMNYTAVESAPLRVGWKKYTLLGPAPPSSWAVLALALKVIERVKFESDSYRSTNFYHYFAEACKHAFAHRMLLGDIETAMLTVDWMLSTDHIRQLQEALHPDRTFETGYYLNFTKSFSDSTNHGTTHLVAVDENRNCVSFTSTVNLVFGSTVISKRTGVLLNDQMDDFSTNPLKPNAFNLPPSPANYVRPGRRPLSSMSPTIVLEGGKPVLIVGASGGPTIITGVIQVLMNCLLFNLDPLTAVLQPRLHDQLLPNEAVVDLTLDESIQKALIARGHRVRLSRGLPDGQTGSNVQAIKIESDGLLYAVSDSRKLGRAAGY
eukprot:GILK01007720.1.p1 GENE.GILK01007720.1~~GILK01007720.1.p1  ORF type:complete len:612 (-),score=78.19 GILK01007720.1:105-1940(-)